MSRKMNWGRMTGQYRNRQIRLAIARSKPKYKSYEHVTNKIDNPDETMVAIVVAIGFMLILFVILSSCSG